MTKQEREEKRRARLQELMAFDMSQRRGGIRYLAGIDEVGRGPLAGPVVTAAVVLPEDFSVAGIDDSKKLTDKMRHELSARIMEEALAYGFGECSNEEIDRTNILVATKKAMRQAIQAADAMLRERIGHAVDLAVIDAVEVEELGFPQIAIVRGDSTSASVAAASILAKVRRDDYMIRMAEEYPGYAFEKNKGYGTQAHYDGIRAWGISPIHRMTFLRNLDEH